MLHVQIFIRILLTVLFLSFLLGQVIARYATCTEAEFENTVAEWLRFATQRNKRERSKENTVEDNTENN